MSTPVVRALAADEARALAPALAEILVDCVAGGASVNFMAPYRQADALRFWEKVADAAEDDTVAVLVAEVDGVILGTVTLACATPPNQPHRAEIRKLLVHRRARRMGIARALMLAAETEAARRGRWLLVLDTANDAAVRLYDGLGWQRAGVIPDYALWPHGGFCDSTIFYKRIA
jgi:ribosomal protein S18 acetylase RimI-like enzyme